jgi:hypothetical protein
MTALSASSELVTTQGPSRFFSAPVAASQLLYKGAMLILDADAGTAKEAPTTLSGHLRVVGVCAGALAKGTRSGVTASNADNSSGAAGDINVLIERGIFSFVNDTAGAGAGTLAAADIGIPVYAIDDATVSADSNRGNRAFAGIFLGLDDNSRAIVEVGMGGRFNPFVTVRSLVANADLSSLQHTIVKLADDGGAAEVASATAITDESIGILVNTPTAGQVAFVVTEGPAPCVVSASGVTAGTRVTSTTGGASISCTTADSHVGSALETGTSAQVKMVYVQTGKTLA